MEAPPPSQPPPLSATTPKAADSVDSSPRSYDADPPPLSSKLRLMCSYGGHIVPRPHDKSLCYIGGDTRIIAIDRTNASLSDLHNRLSKTLLLHNHPFVLKYQLPNEDLDSLISIATDEDLENMVDEYDRLNRAGGGGGGGRLRLFLFPKSPATNCSGASSIEQFMIGAGSTKSEDWFLDALNGKPTNLSTSERGFSESSSVNCLLGLDDDFIGKAGGGVGVKDAEFSKNNNGIGGGVVNQDVHSVPDSPMLDTTSSFGSTSSSPSIMVNLPPIRVHAEENNPKVAAGIEEQFQQINVNLPVVQKQEEVVVGGGFVAAAPAPAPAVVGGEYAKRVYSDDERSDHGGYRVVQQQTQPQVQLQQPQQQFPQMQQRQPGAFDLASPDSASSEGSVTNPLSRQRQAMYQEPIMQMQARVMASQVDPKTADQNNGGKVLTQSQVQESGYVLSGQYEQNHPQIHQTQQYVHAGAQYIPAGAMQMPAYYQVYPSQQQHYQHQPVLDQQYPVYYIPARQTQAYNVQPSHGELAPTAPSTRPQTPPAAQASYNQGRAAPPSKSEMAAGVYRTTSPQLVQVPSGQHQAQYVGVPQMHYPSQSMAPSSAANSTYAYEYADPGHSQMYYTQALPPQLAAQYQTMTSSPTMVLSDASSQLSSENLKQQART